MCSGRHDAMRLERGGLDAAGGAGGRLLVVGGPVPVVVFSKSVLFRD